MAHPSDLLRQLELATEAFGTDLLLPHTALARTGIAKPAPPPAEESPPAEDRARDSAGNRAGKKHATPASSPPPEPPAPPAADTPAPQPAPARPTRHPDPVPALAKLQEEVAGCEKCKLCSGRTQTVFGEGNPRPRVLFIGEAPGAREDRTGRPFVGPAGELLDRIIENAMGLQRADTYIGNINKCRPPGNRDPEPEEVAACLPFLQRQLEILQPEVIVTLGRVAAHNLLSTTVPMKRLRGQDLDYHGTPVVATWHPAYLLRNPAAKRDTWEDVKRVNRLLGLPEVPPGPPRARS